MELIVLGSGTSIPSLRRGAPGYLVRSGSTRVLLDCGPGTLGRLLRAGEEPSSITHLLVSHAHLDHTADIAPMLFAARNPAALRTAPLTIGGSDVVLRHLDDLGRLYGPWIEAESYAITRLDLGGGPRRLGDLEVRACAVPHIPGSIAIRLGDASGRSIVYSGDTGESDALADFARGADLLVIETSTPDEEPLEGHLTPAGAARIAARARPGRTLLTHFYPSCDRADMLGQFRRAFDGAAEIAEDDLRIAL